MVRATLLHRSAGLFAREKTSCRFVRNYGSFVIDAIVSRNEIEPCRGKEEVTEDDLRLHQHPRSDTSLGVEQRRCSRESSEENARNRSVAGCRRGRASSSCRRPLFPATRADLVLPFSSFVRSSSVAPFGTVPVFLARILRG